MADIGSEIAWTDETSEGWFAEWSANGRGQGLLRLSQGWGRDRIAYRRTVEEIESAGLVITPHDEFHAVLDDATFYTIKPRSEPRSDQYSEIVPVPISSLLPTDNLRQQGVVFDHLEN